jgi:hypothetical protein
VGFTSPKGLRRRRWAHQVELHHFEKSHTCLANRSVQRMKTTSSGSS